jgi:hypothetical protein
LPEVIVITVPAATGLAAVAEHVAPAAVVGAVQLMIELDAVVVAVVVVERLALNRVYCVAAPL